MPIEAPPRVALVMRSFLDYRVPVFTELARLLDGRLWVLYSKEHTPVRVQGKIEAAIGDHAIGFDGERAIGYKGNITSELPNSVWRAPYQPGLIKRLKELMPDVVVGDGFFQWTWQALVFQLVYRRSLVICYERTAQTEKSAQWYRRLFRKSILKLVDSMAVNGRLTREYVEQLGMDPLLIVEGQMAADTDTLKAKVMCLSNLKIENVRDTYTRSDESRIYLAVSRLISLKGIDHLLHGWKEFKAETQAVDALIIIGDGPERQVLEQLCRELSAPDVYFLGDVEYDSIHSYYAAADWFVMPSLVDNWSLVVPEAMACGLPILCSRYNGCWPELVHDDVNGWVFDPLKAGDLFRALKLSSETEKYDEMSAASRELVADHSPSHAALAIFKACKMAATT